MTTPLLFQNIVNMSSSSSTTSTTTRRRETTADVESTRRKEAVAAAAKATSATAAAAAAVKKRELGKILLPLLPQSRIAVVVVQLFVLLLFFQRSVLPVSGSYSIMLEAGHRECWSIRIPDEPSVISGDFECLDDDMDESAVTAWLEETTVNPQNKKAATGKHAKLWQSERDEAEGQFTVSVDPRRRFRFCVEYTDPGDLDDEETYVPVGFMLRVLPAAPRTLEGAEMGPDAKRALHMLQEAGDVFLQWQTMLDHFDFLRNREAVHVTMTSQILERVMGWTILEAILVVGMATGQVLYWRKFFEQRRYL